MVAAAASAGSSNGSEVLGPKALNRALLARQLLLRRARRPVSEVLALLVGLQAQSPDAPYYGLWSRLAGFRAAKLRARFAERWPGCAAESLAFAALALPTVQVPPRGIWGSGGLPRLSPVRAWLGRPVCPAPDPAVLVRRYLAVFGPATVADLATWSGLTGVRPLLDGPRAELVVFRDERGRELFDLPAAPRPPASTSAPVRLLAPFDNVLLAHADRTRVLAERYRDRLRSKNGLVLVDGFVAGLWAVERPAAASGPTVLTVRPFRPFAAREEAPSRRRRPPTRPPRLRRAVSLRTVSCHFAYFAHCAK
ncbi:MAG TPA: crosslink repair DNA glycosylase YcaQ family protein [Pseudonocardia sp.]|jgi:hypothetical protein|nr:crosslink repair DNA glycosylase YcaQ family protein [Pseudonocardia sp.]